MFIRTLVMNSKIILKPLKLNFQYNKIDYVRHMCNASVITNKNSNNMLFEHIKQKILLTGPIPISTYMKEVLTNPKEGYYINKDVFGAEGDFITSPEITQIFGELTAIWLINEMNKINNSENSINIIELGPGRGTLMKDILRTFEKLNISKQIENIYFVEVSNELSKIQAKNLCTSDSIVNDMTKERKEKEMVEEETSAENIIKDMSLPLKKDVVDPLCYQSGSTKNDINIKWYKSIQDVPNTHFTLVLAHEFFDALPIHKFIKTENGWREVLIDINKDNELHYVLSKNPTPACVFIDPEELRYHVEISPETGVIVQNIADRLEERGGISLIIDYGHNGDTDSDTFRAYHNHKQTHPLQNIGTSDLTADVNFNYIKKNVDKKLLTFGPITQKHFLNEMHIEARLNSLLSVCSNDHERKILESACRMITDDDQMGNRFKFFSMFPAVLESYYKLHEPVHAFCEPKNNTNDNNNDDSTNKEQ